MKSLNRIYLTTYRKKSVPKATQTTQISPKRMTQTNLQTNKSNKHETTATTTAKKP